MDEQAVRRLFIAFLAMILGAAIGGGLVVFCARPASSGAVKTAVSVSAAAASTTADSGWATVFSAGAVSAPIAPRPQME